MVLRELFLVQEKVIGIVEQAIEIRLEQVGLELVAEEFVCVLVELIDLLRCDRLKDFGLVGWVRIENLLDLR